MTELNKIKQNRVSPSPVFLSSLRSCHLQSQKKEKKNGVPLAILNGSRPKPGRLQKHRLLVRPRTFRLANKAGRLHKNLASPLVRSQTRETCVVQGSKRDTGVNSPWGDPRGQVLDRERCRRCA